MENNDTQVGWEQELPGWLKKSIAAMLEAWEKLSNREECPQWESVFCSLQVDIDAAEANQIVTSEQAWQLRNKYLQLAKPDTDTKNS